MPNDVPKGEAWKLIITFVPSTGSVTVDGPLNNKMLCYSMLEVGRQLVQDHKAAPPIPALNGGGETKQ